jgi:hypothetical protein
MTRTWTVRDDTGRLLPQFEAGSRLEVARKLVPVHFDAFRLQVSPSYREQFDRTVNQVLQRQGWRIVRSKTRGIAATIAVDRFAAGHAVGSR